MGGDVCRKAGQGGWSLEDLEDLEYLIQRFSWSCFSARITSSS